MDKSCLERSPVKIQGAKRTPSKFKPFDNEILVAEENIVLDGQLEFEFSQYQEVLEDAPLTKIGDLTKCGDRKSHGQGVCESNNLPSSQGKSSVFIKSNSEKRSLCQ